MRPYRGLEAIQSFLLTGFGNTPPQTILNVRKERYDRKNRFASEIQRYVPLHFVNFHNFKIGLQ